MTQGSGETGQPYRRRLLLAEDYQPLADALERQSASTVTLTLAEIEALLGLPLPPSARTRSWWVDRSRHAAYRRLLAPLGWTVSEVRRRHGVEAVTFVKAPVRGEERP